MNDNTQMQEFKCNRDTIEAVLLHLIRCPAVFDHGRMMLGPEFFNQADEEGLQIIWSCALEHYKIYNSMAGYAWLSAAVSARLDMDSQIYPETAKDTKGMVDWMFKCPDNHESLLIPAQALDWMQNLLLDRQVGTPMREACQQYDANPDRLPELIDAMRDKITNIKAIGSQPSGKLWPDVFEETPTKLIPTGVDFIDRYMSGGSKAGETHIILGPTGVGKTTIGVQIAMSMATIEAQKESRGGEGKIIAYVSYEDGIESLRARAMSFAAEIEQDTLITMGSMSELSTSNNLKEYERKKYASLLQRGEVVPGELERLNAANKMLAPYVRLMDYSGSRDEFGRTHGSGGLAELCAGLRQYENTSKKKIGGVVLDWAGLCVKQYLVAAGLDPLARAAGELTSFVDKVTKEIGKAFDCPSYVLHQIAGASCGLGPTTRLTHANAMDCKSFGTSAYFAFVLQNKDTSTNTCIMHCSKSRRKESMEDTICYIDGSQGRLVDVSKTFTIDKVTRMIVPKKEVEAFEHAAPRRNRPGRSISLGNMDPAV